MAWPYRFSFFSGCSFSCFYFCFSVCFGFLFFLLIFVVMPIVVLLLLFLFRMVMMGIELTGKWWCWCCQLLLFFLAFLYFFQVLMVIAAICCCPRRCCCYMFTTKFGLSVLSLMLPIFFFFSCSVMLSLCLLSCRGVRHLALPPPSPPPPSPFRVVSKHAKGGVLCDLWHRDLLHQQGHPPRGGLQSAATEIIALASVGEDSV